MIIPSNEKIDFKVRVRGANNQNIFRFNEINSTRLKHLSLCICKKLNLDRFNTTINYSIPYQDNGKISEILTLRQLQLKNGDTIHAEVERTHASQLLTSKRTVPVIRTNKGSKKKRIAEFAEHQRRANKELFKDSLFGLSLILG